MLHVVVLRSIAVLALVTAIGCGGGSRPRPADASAEDGAAGADTSAPEAAASAFALFVVPRPAGKDDYFDLPWPSDLRRQPDGTADLGGIPEPPAGLGAGLFAAAARAQAFSPAGAAIFRFSAALDPTSLPVDGAASLDPGSTVFLVDVDPASPERGQRLPVVVRFKTAANRYIGANWLSVLPHPGFTMQPGRRYAAVVTTGVRAADGGWVAPSPDWVLIRGDSVPADPLLAAARNVYAPLFTAGDGAALPRDRVLAAAVFTTARPTAGLEAAARAVRKTPAPVIRDPACYESGWGYTVCSGTYDDPQFQDGTPPFATAGGRFVLDGSGTPIVQRTDRVRLSITIPPGAPPPDGWPAIAAAMGTGAGFRDQIDLLVAADAVRLPDGKGGGVKAATLGVDAPLVGPRDPTGGDPAFTFFNIDNLEASRDNVRQSVLDYVQAIRLFERPLVDQGLLPPGYQPRIDVSRVAFFGASQGAVTAVLLASVEPWIRAAVIAEGGAGTPLALLYRKKPIATAPYLAGILATELDEFHPTMALLQMVFDPADPLVYGEDLVRRRPTGAAPLHLFVTEAVNDGWMPPETIEALATTLGVPVVLPLLDPVAGLVLRGLAPVPPPVAGNLMTSVGPATGGLLQLEPAVGEPHYVALEDIATRDRWKTFLGGFASTGLPAIVP